ncbi:MAG: hypothetical protein II956_16025 [Bacteroidales bacterium]|nr:hypothetical protein [Bacteroidales bacterium]
MNFGTLGQLASAELEDLEGLSDTELIGYLAQVEGIGATDANTVAVKSKAHARLTGAIARKHGKKGAMSVPRTNNINGESRFLTDKALFENRLSQLNKDIVEKLKRGELQICDWSFYAVKNISGVTNIKMFEDGDITSIATTNVVQGRMFPEDHFLATGLRVLTSTVEVAEGATAPADGKGLHFGLPADAVVNGEFKLGQESTVYMEKTSANIFYNPNRTDVNVGEYRLEAPKMFYPQRTLRWEFDFGAPAPANTWMRVEIKGVRTMKA